MIEFRRRMCSRQIVPLGLPKMEWSRAHLLVMNSRSSAKRPVLPASPFSAPVAPTIDRYDIDDMLTHDRHGLGRVVGLGNNQVHVDFGTEVRTIHLPSSKVTRL